MIRSLHTKWKFPADGEVIRADLSLLASTTPLALIVFCHGFLTFKNWGPWPHFSSRLADLGFAVLKFDFSLNGVTEDAEEITDCRKFLCNTFTRELMEIEYVVERIRARDFEGESAVDVGRLGLLGHSRGGVLQLLYAAKNGAAKGVAALGCPAHFRRLSQEQLVEIEKNGMLQVGLSAKGEALYIGHPIVQDVLAHSRQLDPKLAVESLRAPLMLVHGTQDEVVPVSEALQLHELRKQSPHRSPEDRIHLVEGADHWFNTRHPFADAPPTLEILVRHTETFFKRLL